MSLDGGGGGGYRNTGAGGGGGGGVTSFNARTGAVVPQLGDYDSAIVGDASSWGGPTVEDSLNLIFVATTFLSDQLTAVQIVCDSTDDLTFPSLTWAGIDTVLALTDVASAAGMSRVGSTFTFNETCHVLAVVTVNVPGNGCMFGYRWVNLASPGVGVQPFVAWAGAEPTEHTYVAYLAPMVPGNNVYELQYCRGAGLNGTFIGETLDGETQRTARVTIHRVATN